MGLAAGIAILAIAGAYQVWNRSLRDQLFPKRFAEVEAGFLYRSGQVAPRLIRGVLRDHSIGLVISLSNYDPRNASHRAEKRAVDELDIELLNLHLRGDGTGEADQYVEALEAIWRADRRGEPVLVHCAAGVRRTGAVIALYELLVEGRPPEIAYQELARFDDGGLEGSSLLSFLNQKMATIAAGLVLRGVLERAPDPLPILRFPK
jgi:protein tyrosine/serine phosphatase